MSEVAWREERVRDLQRLVSEARAAFVDDKASRRWQLLLELRQDALAAAEMMLDVAMRFDAYNALQRFDAALTQLRTAETIVAPLSPAPVRYRLSGGRLGTRILHGGTFYAIGDVLDEQQARDLADAGWSITATPS